MNNQLVTWEEALPKLLEHVANHTASDELLENLVIMARQADKLTHLCRRLNIKKIEELEDLIQRNSEFARRVSAGSDH